MSLDRNKFCFTPFKIYLFQNIKIHTLNIYIYKIYLVSNFTQVNYFFKTIRQNFKKASLINNVVVFEDLDPISFADSEGLFLYLSKGVLPLLNAFLKQKLNKDNPMWNDLNTYKLFLDNTISGQNEITYPINSSWEKYCSDNSITYFHALQIP